MTKERCHGSGTVQRARNGIMFHPRSKSQRGVKLPQFVYPDAQTQMMSRWWSKSHLTPAEYFPLAADITVSMKLFKHLGQLPCCWRVHNQHLGQRHITTSVPSSTQRLCPNSGARPHLKANYVTTTHEGCPNSKAPPNAPLKCGLRFGGCTATNFCGLTYPKIPCLAEKEERMKENGDIAWCRLSLLQAWAAEIVT